MLTHDLVVIFEAFVSLPTILGRNDLGILLFQLLLILFDDHRVLLFETRLALIWLPVRIVLPHTCYLIAYRLEAL